MTNDEVFNKIKARPSGNNLFDVVVSHFQHSFKAPHPTAADLRALAITQIENHLSHYMPLLAKYSQDHESIVQYLARLKKNKEPTSELELVALADALGMCIYIHDAPSTMQHFYGKEDNLPIYLEYKSQTHFNLLLPKASVQNMDKLLPKPKKNKGKNKDIPAKNEATLIVKIQQEIYDFLKIQNNILLNDEDVKNFEYKIRTATEISDIIQQLIVLEKLITQKIDSLLKDVAIENLQINPKETLKEILEIEDFLVKAHTLLINQVTSILQFLPKKIKTKIESLYNKIFIGAGPVIQDDQQHKVQVKDLKQWMLMYLIKAPFYTDENNSSLQFSLLKKLDQALSNIHHIYLRSNFVQEEEILYADSTRNMGENGVLQQELKNFNTILAQSQAITQLTEHDFLATLPTTSGTLYLNLLYPAENELGDLPEISKKEAWEQLCAGSIIYHKNNNEKNYFFTYQPMHLMLMHELIHFLHYASGVYLGDDIVIPTLQKTQEWGKSYVEEIRTTLLDKISEFAMAKVMQVYPRVPYSLLQFTLNYIRMNNTIYPEFWKEMKKMGNIPAPSITLQTPAPTAAPLPRRGQNRCVIL